MSTKNRKVYILEDSNVAFSVCPLTEPNLSDKGCIKPIVAFQDHFKDYYKCGYDGIHLHCKQHLDTALRQKSTGDDILGELVWWCDKCAIADKNYDGVHINKSEIDERARIIVESSENEFDIVRIDEHYKEIVIEKERAKSPFFYAGKVETDIHGKTQIHLYIGKSGAHEKAHYFIEPENGRLRYEIGGNNHNIDPSELISEIVVKMKGKTLSHKYEGDENE